MSCPLNIGQFPIAANARSTPNSECRRSKAAPGAVDGVEVEVQRLRLRCRAVWRLGDGTKMGTLRQKKRAGANEYAARDDSVSGGRGKQAWQVRRCCAFRCGGR